MVDDSGLLSVEHALSGDDLSALITCEDLQMGDYNMYGLLSFKSKSLTP